MAALMRPTLTMKGMNELMTRLVELKTDVGAKLTYRAASAAARVVRNAARQNAEDVGLNDSGALIRNITVARSKEFSPPIVAYAVGVRHGTKKQIKDDNDPFYWWMWEFGHHNRFTGRFERRPFMIPALENNKGNALYAMEMVIARGIKRIEAKAKT